MNKEFIGGRIVEELKEEVEKTETVTQIQPKVFKHWGIVFFALLVLGTAITVFLVNYNDYSKPEDLSQEAYDYGLRAVNIADKYLDGRLTGEEAYDKLDSIEFGLKLLEEDDDDTTVYLLYLEVGSLGSSIHLDYTDAEVLEERNKIADNLNYKRR